MILSSAFGVQLDVQTNPGDKMMKKAKLVFRQPLIFSFLASLPFGKLLVLLFRGLTDNLAPFVKLASDIIQSRRQQAEQGIVGRQDMVHLMLTAHKETGAEGARKLSDNEIMAQSVVFLLAGHETSSNTLTFTIYHLALNPEIQEKLRTEIETAIQVSEGGEGNFGCFSSLFRCLGKQMLRASWRATTGHEYVGARNGRTGIFFLFSLPRARDLHDLLFLAAYYLHYLDGFRVKERDWPQRRQVPLKYKQTKKENEPVYTKS